MGRWGACRLTNEDRVVLSVKLEGRPGHPGDAVLAEVDRLDAVVRQPLHEHVDEIIEAAQPRRRAVVPEREEEFEVDASSLLQPEDANVPAAGAHREHVDVQVLARERLVAVLQDVHLCGHRSLLTWRHGGRQHSEKPQGIHLGGTKNLPPTPMRGAAFRWAKSHRSSHRHLGTHTSRPAAVSYPRRCCGRTPLSSLAAA